MLTTLTTLTTLATLGLAQLPQQLPLPEALSGARVEVVLQATSNHFAAQNTSAGPQVLLFGNASSEPRAVRLEPGASVLFPFPRGTAEAFQVEVVSLAQEGWRNTGAVALRDVRRAVGSTLWVQGGDDRSVMWIDEGAEGLAHVSPAGQLVPEAWLASHPELGTFASTHVPVPMPDEGKKSRKPPVIEKRKLPPV